MSVESVDIGEVLDYRSLWLGGNESGIGVWQAKVRLADRAIEKLEKMLRIAWEETSQEGFFDVLSWDEYLTYLQDKVGET